MKIRGFFCVCGFFFIYIFLHDSFKCLFVKNPKKMIKDTNVLRAVLVTIDLSSEMNSKKKKFIIIKFVTIECILKYQSIKVFKNFLFLFLFICL